MTENNLRPCPFAHRCAFANENCSEEMSASCEVITNTTPPATPEWNPAELVTVTLSREQWQDISIWLQYCIDWHGCRMVWWRDCCDDKKMGAEIAAQHETAIKAHENVLQIIEEATHGKGNQRSGTL